MRHPLLLGIAATTLVLGGGAGWWIWQGAQRTATLAAGIPARPDLARWPAELAQRIGAAEQEARTGRSPARALGDLARLYHANGFYFEAVNAYAALQALEPAQPQWPHLRAHIEAGFGRVEIAKQLWERVVTLKPDYTPALVRLGDVLLKSNKTREAAHAYERALEREAKNAYALVGLARIDLAAGAIDVARTRLETAVRATEGRIGADLLATVCERSGDMITANMLRGAQRASGSFSDVPDPWLDELMMECFDSYRVIVAAGTARHRGDPRTNRRLLERALKLAPDSAPVLFQMGGTLLAEKDFAGARTYFERCVAVQPDFADGWGQLAGIFRTVGDAEAADRTLARGLELCPGSPGLHMDRARQLARAGRHEEAFAAFRESARLRPEEPDARLELGELLIQLGRTREGIAELESSLTAEPGHPRAITTLAYEAITSASEVRAARWMREVLAQPRVPAERRDMLVQAFREKFGRSP